MPYLVPTRAELDRWLETANSRQIQGIPQVFHQMWYDKIPPRPGIYVGPEKYLPKMATFLRQNPDWTQIIWTNDTVDYLLSRPEMRKYKVIFDQLPYAVQRADLARLVVMWRYGGVYADLDFETLAPIDPLLQNFTTEEMILFNENDWSSKGLLFPCCLSNGCIIARPGAGVLVELIQNIEFLIRSGESPKSEVLYLTGPRAIQLYLYGEIHVTQYPKWRKREFSGRNRSRVNNLKRKIFEKYFYYDKHDSSGWAPEVVLNAIEHYCIIGAALIVILLVLACAVLYFLGPMGDAREHQRCCGPKVWAQVERGWWPVRMQSWLSA